MSKTAKQPVTSTASEQGADPRRWRALIVIAIAQLMIVLDGSIVNIALPSIQSQLSVSDGDRQWIVTAYTLAFGSLLLLGGRIADYSGRKRMFLIGLIGFAIASAIGGFAQNSQMLFAARGLQGVFAAILAPAALSLISVTFTTPKERSRAFGVYGAVAGVGAAIGLIMGGLLTEYLDWRWCFLVNVPIALGALILAIVNIKESKLSDKTRHDIPGAITATLGLFFIVFGITRVETDGWESFQTIGYLSLGVALMGLFILIQSRSKQPMLPLRIVTNRVRGAAYLAALFVGIAGISFFLFMSYYLQLILKFTPIQTGLSFLPFSFGVIIAAVSTGRFLPKFGPRFITFTGFILMSVAMYGFSRLTPDSEYLTGVLPFLIPAALGFGFIFVPLSSTALLGVGNSDSGIASATLNTSQQIGGTIGIAALNTLAASVTTNFIKDNSLQVPTPEAFVSGFSAAFQTSSVILLSMGIVWVFMIGKNVNSIKP